MAINLFDWQTVVALLIVFVAIIVLARKTWQSFFGASPGGCGTSCGNCPASTQPTGNSIKVTKLIQLEKNK